MAKSFKMPTMQEFEIMENESKFGTLRVWPNAIRWKPKGAHQFHSVTIEQFEEFAMENGELKQQ